MSTQWFENFFQGLALECWDRCMPPEVTKAEVDFLVDVLTQIRDRFRPQGRKRKPV